jgi:mRNA deadenylase 3'-5' endonuclease subunit Ccr4
MDSTLFHSSYISSQLVPTFLSRFPFITLFIIKKNILAQEYARPNKYPWVSSPHILDWEYRMNRIVQLILDDGTMKADIVCLQEVQIDLFPELMSRLSATFDSILQNVTATHNVGTAILVRKDSRLQIKRAESRSRALITVLQDKNNEELLYVSTVHLDADTASDRQTREFHQRQRENQLKSLLKRLNNHCLLDNNNIETVPIIIAGDFNMLRDNPINAALTKGELSPQLPIHFHDAYLKAEQYNQRSLPLYQQNQNDYKSSHHLVKTFCGGAVLDYIFVSQHIHVVDTLLYHPGSSYYGIERLPSKDYPSDHFPVGIDFQWPS